MFPHGYPGSSMILYALYGMQVWLWSTSSHQKRNKDMSLQTDVPVSEANGQNTPHPPIMLVESHRSWRGLNFGTITSHVQISQPFTVGLLSYPFQPFQSSHLQLSTAHWVTPELSEWLLRPLEHLTCHLRSDSNRSMSCFKCFGRGNVLFSWVKKFLSMNEWSSSPKVYI